MKPTRPFGHLLCTDFDHFWNDRREWCAHAYTGEKFPNFCTGFSRPQKQLQMCNFEGVLVVKLLLKQHNFGWWELFRGHIPSMRVLVRDEKSQFHPSVRYCCCMPFTFWHHSEGSSVPSLSLYCTEWPNPLQPISCICLSDGLCEKSVSWLGNWFFCKTVQLAVNAPWLISSKHS